MRNAKERSRGGSRTGSPWEDLCPDLLNSICEKLPSAVDRAEFGSVCKSWRRIYSATADYTALRSTHNANFTMCTFRRGPTITSHPQQLPHRLRRDFSGASVVGRDGSGWWLMSNSAGEIFCCFNPLLQSSGMKSVIDLPRRSRETIPRQRAAFSAPPTDPNSVILIVHGGGGNPTTFSWLRRSRNWWTVHSNKFHEAEICAGIGYRAGKFLWLFESGDVLIFEIEKEGGGGWEVSLMLAPRPLAPERFLGVNYLRAAVRTFGLRDGGFEMVSWERVEQGPDGSFRLLTVVREKPAKELENCYEDDCKMTLCERWGCWSNVSLVPQSRLTVALRRSLIAMSP